MNEAKRVIALLLEDARRLQQIEPNAGTEARIAITEHYLKSSSNNDKCRQMTKLIGDMVDKKVSDTLTQTSKTMGKETLPDSAEKKPFANLQKRFEKVEVGKRLQENSVMLAAVLITILTEDVFEDVKKSSYLNYCRLARRAYIGFRRPAR